MESQLVTSLSFSLAIPELLNTTYDNRHEWHAKGHKASRRIRVDADLPSVYNLQIKFPPFHP